jgi:hypothetical protein
MSTAEQGVAPHQHDDEPQPPVGGGSPLERLRAATAQRKAETFETFDVPGDLGLVAKVGLIEDGEDAQRAIRMMTGLVTKGVAKQEDEIDEAAHVIAAAVMSLHYRNEQGDLEQIEDEHGIPLRFDNRYGPAVGVPDLTTGSAAVLAVFTTGDDPPRLDAISLIAFATNIAVWITGRGGAADLVPGS